MLLGNVKKDARTLNYKRRGAPVLRTLGKGSEARALNSEPMFDAVQRCVATERPHAILDMCVLFLRNAHVFVRV